MDVGEFFAREWEPMVPRIRAMLTRAGAPSADLDDLVQETALRLFTHWSSVDQTRSVEPLARRIAINLWRDQWRGRGHREVIGPVPEQLSQENPERVALARIQVKEVSRALSEMPATTASVLRRAVADAEVGPIAGVRTPPAVRMARSRARRALAACLQVASGVIAGIAIGTRTLGRPARATVTVGALATLALCLGQSSAPAHHDPTSTWEAAAPVDVARHGPAASAAVRHATRPAAQVRQKAQVPAAEDSAPRVRHHEPYRIDAGPAELDVFVDVQVAGHGARVSQPQPGQPQPLCLYGETPASPVAIPCN